MKAIPFLLLLLLAGCAEVPPPALKQAAVAPVKLTASEIRYLKSPAFDQQLDQLNASLDVANAQLDVDIAKNDVESAERSIETPLPRYYHHR